MTKKHFEGLAEIVALELDFLSDSDRFKVAEELARFCNQHNANFDYMRFLAACKCNETLNV